MAQLEVDGLNGLLEDLEALAGLPDSVADGILEAAYALGGQAVGGAPL